MHFARAGMRGCILILRIEYVVLMIVEYPSDEEIAEAKRKIEAADGRGLDWCCDGESDSVEI
jgi:hypothetical protein